MLQRPGHQEYSVLSPFKTFLALCELLQHSSASGRQAVRLLSFVLEILLIQEVLDATF